MNNRVKTSVHAESRSTGATQAHPEAADNREDHDVGGDSDGEVLV